MLTPHSIIHGDACFAYFNKIWGIPVFFNRIGHKRKGSERANVVRFNPQSGHRELASVCPFSSRS
jgi:hypothetical protein